MVLKVSLLDLEQAVGQVIITEIVGLSNGVNRQLLPFVQIIPYSPN